MTDVNGNKGKFLVGTKGEDSRECTLKLFGLKFIPQLHTESLKLCSKVRVTLLCQTITLHVLIQRKFVTEVLLKMGKVDRSPEFMKAVLEALVCTQNVSFNAFFTMTRKHTHGFFGSSM